MKVALTIAGSDSSGGAGIQADLKAMSLNGVFAESVITALTAQNTTGVSGIMDVTSEFLEKQMDAVFTDIFPDAVKIGMVSDKDLIRSIALKLKQCEAENIVLDPVMVATSGSKLLKDDAIEALKEELFPLALLITPNIPEAELISSLKIEDEDDMEKAAQKIYEDYGVNVLLKGGHRINDANDYLYANGSGIWIKGERIDNPNTHGTGCTLSSAIAANLAKGYGLEEAIRKAKKYLEGCLKDGLNLGKGSGPMNHAFDIKNEYKK
ncbi:bifunctional hydroxymethylpyrimidine kinase/phosphomethylpyrimidine kinase [Anaerococcus marasmi]|uniref:bifunctional hydroxymethylpyrimidine kinase/phosphomethylpyrimidine kinase n=1 Tax=Anaerococcus marasmi TaxID=2057797 RepID=UPI000CF84AB7|nr:bifunctional hydroxymethylpyrimidine kinase/phosphomethylpyrimidine kinase [Anaerococcus marasmi]